MKKIAIINDLSGLGRCSLTAALPVISTMGVQACPLPTAILSAQTGFEDYHCVDFTKEMSSIQKKWKHTNTSFDGIYTGFVSSDEQIDVIYDFLRNFKTKNNFLLVDPIMGDDGETYDIFTDTLRNKMIKLTKLADIITPNLTELCLISNSDYQGIQSVTKKEEKIELVKKMCNKIITNDQKIIVTGVRFLENNMDMVGNILVSNSEFSVISHPYLGGSYSGTGDIFASCITGAMAKDMDINTAITVASNFLKAAITESVEKKSPYREGVLFENHLASLGESIKYSLPLN